MKPHPIRGTKGRGHGSVIPLEIVALFTEALKLPPGHSCRLRFESWRRCRDALWWASQLKRLYWEHILSMPGLSPVWLAIHMVPSKQVIDFLGHEPRSLTKKPPSGAEDMPYYLVIERVATGNIEICQDSTGSTVVSTKPIQQSCHQALEKHRSWLRDHLGSLPADIRQRLEEAEQALKTTLDEASP